MVLLDWGQGFNYKEVMASSLTIYNQGKESGDGQIFKGKII